MDIESKKTALNDEASIYQKRKSAYTKKDIKKLSGKEKWIYFKDYHLKKVLIVLLLIVAVCAIIREIVVDKSECVLNVACLNECQIEETEKLADELKAYVQPKNEDAFAGVVSYNLENPQVNMSYSMQITAGGIDIVICTYDYFVEASEQGIFVELNDFLPKETYDTLSEKLLISRIKETDVNDSVTYGDYSPYGIDISGNSKFEEFNDYQGRIVLCVLRNAPNIEESLKAISYFTE